MTINQLLTLKPGDRVRVVGHYIWDEGDLIQTVSYISKSYDMLRGKTQPYAHLEHCGYWARDIEKVP